MDKLSAFENLIDFFKKNKPKENSKFLRFDELLNDFRRLHLALKNEPEKQKSKFANFTTLLNDFSTLAETVYPSRFQETEKLLTENAHKIIFSSFELMEHNYRENSHSNILRHIFHYKFWNLGKVVLSKFIESATNDTELSTLILNSNYEIHREFFTKDGRIDLLIEDKKNNFVVVIENKILANIAVKEYADDNTVSKTQLHNYISFISEKYKGYKTCFILLSLNPEEDIELGEFVQTDYKNLLGILNSIETDNNIVNDYKILLQSLFHNKYDKEWLLELRNKIIAKQKINSLNTFAIANTYFQ